MKTIQDDNDCLAGKTVLVLDSDKIQSLPLLKAFHQLGCAVDTVGLTRHGVGAVSRFGRRHHVIPVKPSQEDEYLTRLIRILEGDHYDLVISLDDASARLLSKNRERLSCYAFIAAERWENFELADDKLRTMRVCMENGIPCPKTFSLSDNLNDILAAVDSYPAALKPRVACSGKGFRKVSSREELETVYDASVREFGPMLVEEYIPQTGTQYKCDVYIDRSGEVKSAFVYEKPRWYPVSGGSSCCNVTVDRPDLIAHSVSLLQKIGWRGYADLDLIEDPRDGSVRIMEINPRICGSIKIAFLAGIDFARQILEDASGMPVTRYTDYKKGVVMRHLLFDALWFLKSPRRFRTKPSWFRFWKFSGQVFSWDDPIPALAYLLKLIRRQFGKIARTRPRASVPSAPPQDLM